MKGTPAVSRGWCTGCNGPSGPETNDHCRAVRAQRGRYCAHQKSLLRVKTLDRLLAALLAVVLVGAGPSVQAQPDALSVQGVTITGTDLDRAVPPGPLGHIQVFGTSNATQLSTEAPRFAPNMALHRPRQPLRRGRQLLPSNSGVTRPSPSWPTPSASATTSATDSGHDTHR